MFGILDLILLSAVAAAPSLVAPVDGAPYAADLQAIGDKQATFRLPSGQTKQVALAELGQWGEWRECAAGNQILLVDGSLLVGDVLAMDKDSLAVDWADGTAKLPLETVAGVIFAPPLGIEEQDTLREQIRALGGESDTLLLANGDRLAGEIQAATDQTVKIKLGGQELSIARGKLAAMALNPALAAKPKPDAAVAWLGFADGSQFLAKAVSLEGGKLSAQLLVGPKVTVAAEKLVALAPAQSRAVYLSDLKASGYQHIPFLSLAWPYKNDQNVTGARLRAGGRLWRKGLGMHAASRLTYELDKPYKTLAADIAIDDQTRSRGSAIFRVYLDNGEGKRRLAYESPIVRGGDKPRAVSVDVSGARRVSLLVDFADEGDELARADWLEARIVP